MPELNDAVTAAVARWREHDKPEVVALIKAVTQTQVTQNGSLQTIRDWEEVGKGALEGILRHWYWMHLSTLPEIPEFHVSLQLPGVTILAVVDKAVMQRYGGKP